MGMTDINKKYLSGEGLQHFYNILKEHYWDDFGVADNIQNVLDAFKLNQPLIIKDSTNEISFDGGEQYTIQVGGGLELAEREGTGDVIKTGIYDLGHTNSIAASAATPSSGNISYGDTVYLPEITFDEHGHITATRQVPLTFPEAENYQLPPADEKGNIGGIRLGFDKRIVEPNYMDVPLKVGVNGVDSVTTASGNVGRAYVHIEAEDINKLIEIPELDPTPYIKDHLVYKGKVGGSSQLVLPAKHEVGEVWEVEVEGTYAGLRCIPGDKVLCIQAGSEAVNEHWTLMNTNISVEAGSSETSWGAETTLATIKEGRSKSYPINIKLPGLPVMEEGKISDKLNVTNLDDIKAAQASILTEKGVKFYIISDSYGRLPSKDQDAVSVSADCIKQLTVASPNSGVQKLLLKNIPVSSFKSKGMSVGDIIALARVRVSIDDLCTALKLSNTITRILKSALKLGGLLGSDETIEVFQYKVWSTTGTRWKNYYNPDGTVVEEGVEGLMSVWDKEILDKVPTLATEAMKNPSRWCSEARKCLESGVYPYVNRELVVREWNSATNSMDIITKDLMLLNTELGPDVNTPQVINDDFWGTVISTVSSTPDGGGYYTIEQTLYSRAGYFNGVDFKRMFFFQYYTEEEITALQEAYNPDNYGGMVFDEYMNLTNQAWRASDGRYIKLQSVTGDFMWYPLNSYAEFVSVKDNFTINDDIISNINNELYNKGIIDDVNKNIINDDGYITPSMLDIADYAATRRYRGFSGMDDAARIHEERHRTNIIGSGSLVTTYVDNAPADGEISQRNLIIHSKATIDDALTESEIKKAINQAIPGLL